MSLQSINSDTTSDRLLRGQAVSACLSVNERNTFKDGLYIHHPRNFYVFYSGLSEEGNPQGFPQNHGTT